MLRRPKHSTIEVVAPKEEEDVYGRRYSNSHLMHQDLCISENTLQND